MADHIDFATLWEISEVALKEGWTGSKRFEAVLHARSLGRGITYVARREEVSYQAVRHSLLKVIRRASKPSIFRKSWPQAKDAWQAFLVCERETDTVVSNKGSI